MGAFDGNIKIQRAVKDPHTDHKLPSPKSLSWGEVTGVTGLAGTTGNHCELVHGDHWRQIDADLTTIVAGDETRTITGDYMRTVTGDDTHSVIGNHTQSVTGNQSTSVIGDAIAMHVGTCIETQVDSKVETYGKHRFELMSANTLFQYYDSIFQGYGAKFQVCMFQTQLNGITINIITNPAAALIADMAFASQVPSWALPTAATPAKGSTPATAAKDTGEATQAGVGAADVSGIGAVAALAPAAAGGSAAASGYGLQGLSFTLNTGLNMSMDVYNVATTGVLKMGTKAMEGDLKAFFGTLFGGKVDGGAAQAKAHARVGVPPHTPVTG
jgi:hypothetical protein